MFGLSVEHLLILSAAALYILGPERLPGAASWLARALRQARDFASGAQARLETELGPEYHQLRKPLQDLQVLRQFDPGAAVRSYLFDDAAPARASPSKTEVAGLRPGNGRPPTRTPPDASQLTQGIPLPSMMPPCGPAGAGDADVVPVAAEVPGGASAPCGPSEAGRMNPWPRVIRT